MADDDAAPDASDLAAEDNARRDEARRSRNDADVVRRIMSHRNGRDWFFRQLTRCNIYRSSFVPGQPDVTAFELGQENIGKQLMLAAIDASADLYMKMLTEQKEEETRLRDVRRGERKSREAEDNIGVRMQGFDLPAPTGFDGAI